MRNRLAKLQSEIEIGWQQCERGEVVDGPGVFAEIRRMSQASSCVKKANGPRTAKPARSVINILPRLEPKDWLFLALAVGKRRLQSRFARRASRRVEYNPLGARLKLQRYLVVFR